jgi:hypothetical protein
MDDDKRVNRGWMFATGALGVVVVAQFFWWNAKAPEVLNLGGKKKVDEVGG